MVALLFPGPAWGRLIGAGTDFAFIVDAISRCASISKVEKRMLRKYWLLQKKDRNV